MSGYRYTIGVVLVLCAVTTFIGCTDDPLPPAEVRRQVDSNLSDLLGEIDLWMSEAALELEDLPVPAAFALVQQVTGVDTPLAQAIGQLPTRLERVTLQSGTIANAVSTQIFGDDQYHGDGSYDVSPAALCAIVAPNSASACVALVEKLGLRLQTTLSPQPANADPADEGIVVGVQIGPTHLEPLTLTLTAQRQPLGELGVSLTTALDLSVLQRALAGIPGLPATRMAGHLTVTVEGGAFGVIVGAQIDDAISVSIASASGNSTGYDAFSLSSASGSFQLDLLDDIENRALLELRLGETEADLPAGTDRTRHGIAMRALNANILLTLFPSDLFTVNDLSFGGPLTLSRDGTTAQTFDLNPDDGGSLSFSITKQPALGFSPEKKLDLRMTTDHAVLADNAPAFDVSRILIDGTVVPTASPDRIKLVDHTFQLDTEPAGHGFAAIAGQCITGTDNTAANPSFVEWSVAACP